MPEKRTGGGVLVVDDEEEILELLREYLRVRGYQTWTARNGQEALEKIRNEPIDVILTDMKMPTLGGIELLELVSGLARPMSVVMMTGFGTVETAIKAMKLGAADYVLKPFKLRDVHEALQTAHGKVERVRSQRVDAALREFYETCFDIDEPSGISEICVALVELLITRLGLVAAGIWCDTDDGRARKWQAGDSNTLEELDTYVSTRATLAMEDTKESHIRVLDLGGGLILGACLQRGVLHFGDIEILDRGLQGLSLAFARTRERVEASGK